MTVHIKLDKQSYCQCSWIFIPALEAALHKERILATCAHHDPAKAARFVELLKEHGLAEARVVDGPCDQRDSFEDLG